MLSYEEHQILFHLGEYSSETSSLQYSGLNPNWVHPQPPYSEPLTRRLNPSAKPIKPFSAVATTRPSNLDDEVLLDDNVLTHLHPAKKNSHGFQSPSKQPPKPNLFKTSDNSDVSDSPPPVDASTPKIQPTIEVANRYDEELSNEKVVAGAECHFTLSSPMKQDLDSDVNWLPSLIENTKDFHIQNDLIMEDPPKITARGKKWWQMSDLPHSMNNYETWRKMLIPTVYWHFGN